MGGEITLDFDKDFEKYIDKFPPSFEILCQHNMVALSLVRPTTMPLEFKKSLDIYYRGCENSTNQAYPRCFVVQNFTNIDERTLFFSKYNTRVSAGHQKPRQ